MKGTAEDVRQIADSEQVAKYLSKYRQALVTNYRDFVLMRQEDGKPVQLKSYRLAESESAFWSANPYALAEAHGERFVEYLKRVMLHAAPLASPEDVAWFLASYARDAKARIKSVDLPALTFVRSVLEEALGIKFEGERGERFFRSTLVQTLFYGVFSAWVLWCKQHPPAEILRCAQNDNLLLRHSELNVLAANLHNAPFGPQNDNLLLRHSERSEESRFNWHEAVWYLPVPMVRALFEQVATPSKLGPLGLVEVLDWTAAVLNRVDRAAFFERFEDGHAVQCFYEPFLEAFDPALRKELGVWHTPTEIVQYMVARVVALDPERHRLLEKRPRQRLELHARRLSGHQKMAQLPRARFVGTPADQR